MTKNGPCSPETDMLVRANRQKRRDDEPDNVRRAQDDNLSAGCACWGFLGMPGRRNHGAQAEARAGVATGPRAWPRRKAFGVQAGRLSDLNCSS